MAPPPKLKSGDWLIHTEFRKASVKRAEIVTLYADSKVLIYLDGEPGCHGVTRADLTRWWDLFVPPSCDLPIPPSVKPGAAFLGRNEKFSAVVHEIRNGWLSFTETSVEYGAVFRIKSYEDFAPHWVALRKPSVWEWIRKPAV